MLIVGIIRGRKKCEGGKSGSLGGETGENKEEELEQEEEGRGTCPPGPQAQPAVLARALPGWPSGLLMHSFCILLTHLPGVALAVSKNGCPLTCPAAK